MKYKLLRVLILFSLLALLSSAGSVLAQSPLAPGPSPVPQRPPETSAWGPESGKPHLPQASVPGTDMAAQSLTLGPSGLSYRYLKTFGTTRVPYLADHTHLNYPWGIGATGSSIWIGELWGDRALKYSNTGSFQQQIGTPGMYFDPTAFQKISDVAVDAAGNTWVADFSYVAEYDPSGNLVGSLGVKEEGGTDNSHFYFPVSIAFDSVGNIYVSDGNPSWDTTGEYGSQRVQVLDGSGNYLATIGVTEEIGQDNDHFWGPRHIAVYGTQLYVADSCNQRVQIFDITTPSSPSYVTTLGVTYEPGSDNAHFYNPFGVAADADYIYVADTGNNRVQVFNRTTRVYVKTIGGTWGAANNQFKNPTDIAVDAGHRLYVADFANARVQQFTHSGATFTYARTYGVTGVPYLTDDHHFNKPGGVAVAGDGSIYLAEDFGQRLIKLNAAGALLWSVDAPGALRNLSYADNRLENSSDVALDSSGHVYVSDRQHGRVQIYNSVNGSFITSIGGLSRPGGVHIAPNGYIYVADSDDETVKIYNSNRSLVAMMGQSGVSGSDNAHFDLPEDVTVDGNGNIYVADQYNHRVQVFNSNRVYMRTMGATGECGADFAHFCSPTGLAVDSSNRLYVADDENCRIQVFGSNGAYLTTIGGDWGSSNGLLRAAYNVAVDSAGNVYIADWENDRIQKFARGVPGWTQANINGFGDRWNRDADRLATFDGQLYDGGGLDGAQIWRTIDGKFWSPMVIDSFGDSSNGGICDLTEFNGNLYAGTWNCTNADCTTSNGGQIWRTNGSTWSQTVSGGFGNTNNLAIDAFAMFSGNIYAATSALDGVFQIYRSSTGDSGTWSAVMSNGFGGSGVAQDLTMDVYGGYLYVGIGRNGVGELWRTNNGTTWSPVFTNGLSAHNSYVSSMAGFNGAFYIGLENATDGGEVWKSTNGTTFTRIFKGGLGKATNMRPSGLYVSNGSLYLIFSNMTTGGEVWRSPNGSNWTQIGFAGWGDANNRWVDGVDKGAVAFAGRLYLGTYNGANGGEIWSTLIPLTASYGSVGAQDGWILESGENTNLGGSLNATAATFQLGDDAANKQYRAILSFNTSGLPDNAVIQSALLKIKQSGTPTGTNPFSALGNLLVDIRKPFFGTANPLQLGDFNAPASATKVGTFSKTPSAGWYSVALNAAGQTNVNKTGLTQFRLYFSLDDNNNHLANLMKFFSGNFATAASQPTLVITYTVP